MSRDLSGPWGIGGSGENWNVGLGHRRVFGWPQSVLNFTHGDWIDTKMLAWVDWGEATVEITPCLPVGIVAVRSFVGGVGIRVIFFVKR